jgi:uncharacterized protein (DUF1015 family)
MVEFRAVSGLEYNDNVAGPFASVIAPPYDVIDDAQRKAFAARSPYNVVRITLPDAEGNLDKYAAAARTAGRWMSEGALVRTQRAFYVIEQRFTVNGRELVRTAVLGELRLSRWREAGVFPHEVTLPKPRADRLSLYKALKLQPEPIFSLFEDASGAIRKTLVQAKAAPPYRAADGPEGSFDRVWKVADAAIVRRLTTLFAPERFFMADGHHRYETALAYRDELADGRDLAPDHPANFVLMAAVAFDDPGLVILPTHRLLCGRGDTTVERALEGLSADYEAAPASPADLESLTLAPAPAIGVYAGGKAYLLRMREPSRIALAASAGALMASLNVYEVLERVLPRFFTDVKAAVAEERIRYTHDFAQAAARVDSGECAAAIVLAPISVRQIAAVAESGSTMPPKSTYFYPKLPTGVALKPLE